MAIDKGVWEWSGFKGAPGYSIFYATPDAGVSGLIKSFFDTVADMLPGAVTIQNPSDGDRIDETTGLLTGVWTGGIGGTTVATGSGSYAGPAGAAITWGTNGIVAGKRVRGRTFLVPLHSTAYMTDGTLLDAVRTNIQTAADTLVTAAAGDLLVWSRPRVGLAGSAHPVVSARVTDQVAVLRSRRS